MLKKESLCRDPETLRGLLSSKRRACVGILKSLWDLLLLKKESLCRDPETFMGFTFVKKESLCGNPEIFVGFTFVEKGEPV